MNLNTNLNSFVKKYNLNPTMFDENIFKIFSEHLKKNDLNYSQFYNNEIETDEYSFIEFMKNFQDNKGLKVLNKSYYDIEVYVTEEKFPEPLKADFMVNSIAVYNNIKNEAKIFALVNDCIIKDQDVLNKGVNELYKSLCQSNNSYQVIDINIELITFNSEKELFIKYHEYMKELGTLMLIGFNSLIFDDPYMMNRGIKLFGNENYYDIVSEFQVTKYSPLIYEWPDYILVDLLKLYQPVDAGGMGFGKSLPSYKLDSIAKAELDISKLELEENFCITYKNDPIRYFTYNLLDTLLVYKIDERLKFLEQIFSLAKYNNSTMGAAINGRSIMYNYRNDLIYSKQDKLIRNKKYSKEVFYPICEEKK